MPDIDSDLYRDSPDAPGRRPQPALETSKRHHAVQQIARWFDWEHLRLGLARDVSMSCGQFAQEMIDELPNDGPELIAGLRKLLEAKDCFVRAALAQEGAAGNPYT